MLACLCQHFGVGAQRPGQAKVIPAWPRGRKSLAVAVSGWLHHRLVHQNVRQGIPELPRP